MAIAWFICPYVRQPGTFLPFVVRYCAMNDFTQQIQADGGIWTETEILGDRAIVKVNALAATLTVINQRAGFRRIPLDRLDDSLSLLTATQRAAIRDEIIDAGYTLAELNAAIPDLASAALRDVLHFMARRRRTPRYDQVNDVIVLDGLIATCRSVESVDSEVS